MGPLLFHMFFIRLFFLDSGTDKDTEHLVDKDIDENEEFPTYAPEEHVSQSIDSGSSLMTTDKEKNHSTPVELVHSLHSLAARQPDILSNIMQSDQDPTQTEQDVIDPHQSISKSQGKVIQSAQSVIDSDHNIMEDDQNIMEPEQNIVESSVDIARSNQSITTFSHSSNSHDIIDSESNILHSSQEQVVIDSNENITQSNDDMVDSNKSMIQTDDSLTLRTSHSVNNDAIIETSREMIYDHNLDSQTSIHSLNYSLDPIPAMGLPQGTQRTLPPTYRSLSQLQGTQDSRNLLSPPEYHSRFPLPSQLAQNGPRFFHVPHGSQLKIPSEPQDSQVRSTHTEASPGDASAPIDEGGAERKAVMQHQAPSTAQGVLDENRVGPHVKYTYLPGMLDHAQGAPELNRIFPTIPYGALPLQSSQLDQNHMKPFRYPTTTHSIQQTQVKAAANDGQYLTTDSKHESHPSQLRSQDGKGYVCRFCGKFSRSRRDYQRHEMTHTGEKPFKCEVSQIIGFPLTRKIMCNMLLF